MIPPDALGSSSAPGVHLASIEPLFYSPVMRFKMEGSAELNRRLLEEVAARRATSAGVRRSNQLGWHSEEDFFLRTEPASVELRGRIIEAIGAATAKVAPTFDAATRRLQCEGWFNVNGKGAFNTPHDHPGWVWSGSYYVSVPATATGTSGCIEFLDVRTNVRAITIDGANCFASKVTFRPEEGTILLFPAYLRHWVYPHDEATERVSVAFNARFALK